MRFILKEEHHRLFKEGKKVEFQFLASPKDCNLLDKEIKEFVDLNLKPSDPESYEKLFRSVKTIETIITKNRIAYFIGEFLYRRPIWLVYDKFFSYPDPIIYDPKEEEHECSLLLYLKNPDRSGDAFFFKPGEIPNPEDYKEDTSVIVMSFTYRRKPESYPVFSLN